MTFTMQEAIEFVEENDVKFIRLAFCDLFGVQKNISIMPGELRRAFSEGIGFDASAFPGFVHTYESDLVLRPDWRTLAVLPWRPTQGKVIRLYCDVCYPDGRPFEGDGRHLLRQAVRRARDLELSCNFGTECEFYLFEMDANGQPTRIPHDRAGYCDIAPLDRAENVRRQICLTLEEMGIQPERSHHEQGPGQNEIDFKYAGALTAADNLTTFKSVVKTMAHTSGLFASFLPKPIPNKPGSGLHINISLCRGGRNIFETNTGAHSQTAEQFIAGILNRVGEITAFLNPLTNSYHRFGSFEAPRYITWSHQNRSQLVRIPAAQGEQQRMELRSPDPSANPYLAFALLIHAGLDGVEQGLALPAPCNTDLYAAPADLCAGLPALPDTLAAALEEARASAFVRRMIPADVLDAYLSAKARECALIRKSADADRMENDLYFERF